MDNIEWGDWKPGVLDPKLFMDNTINFESRRANGIWEYRLGYPRQPTIDHIYLYSQDLEIFGLDVTPESLWNIIIETADGTPNGNIIIKRL